MLMSTCSEKDSMNWTMKGICDQNDLDRADIQTAEEQALYRDILDKFETTVFDQQFGNKQKKQSHNFFLKFSI